MTFDDWSLNKKLRLNFFLYLTCFCLFMGASLSGLNLVKKQFDEVATDSVPDIVAILELKSISKRLFAEIQGFVATGDEDEVEEFAESIALFDDWLGRWDVHDHDTEELRLKNEMKEHKRVFNDYANSIFALADTQDELIETFEALIEHQRLAIEPQSSVTLTELALNNDLNHFYRLTYLTMLTSSEDDDDEQSEEQETNHQHDNASANELDVGVDERLEDLSEILLSKSSQLDDSTESQRIEEIVRVGIELVEVSQSIGEYLERVEDYEDEILDTLDHAVALQNNEVNGAFQLVHDTVQRFVFFVSLIGLLGIGLSYFFYQLIRRSVTTRLDELVNSAKTIANGDLDHMTRVYGSDEFGQLSDNFNQMTRSLRETTVSKDYVANLLASMTESVIVTSSTGVIEVVNDETLKVTGYSRESLIGQPLSMLLASHEDVLSNALDSRQQNYRTECEYQSQDGSSQPVMFSSSQLINSNGVSTGIICVASNVQQLKTVQAELERSNNELKTAQSQLVQASKLASIGELSAGVAHELNQPLMIIRNGGQLIERKRMKGKLDDEKLDKFVSSVLSNSKRMMKIIDHLRTFSRHSSSEFVDVDVNNVVSDSILMVGEQLKLHGVTTGIHLSQTPLYVKGDSNQLEQVLLNLVSNARDALNSSNKDDKQLSLVTRLSSDGTHVEIEVSDNGGGIPVDVQSRIFDPFYTTKDEGKGTGLGLSISYGIITDHKGSIDVTSDSESGTSMCICLPLMQPSSINN